MRLPNDLTASLPAFSSASSPSLTSAMPPSAAFLAKRASEAAGDWADEDMERPKSRMPAKQDTKNVTPAQWRRWRFVCWDMKSSYGGYIEHTDRYQDKPSADSCILRSAPSDRRCQDFWRSRWLYVGGCGQTHRRTDATVMKRQSGCAGDTWPGL